MSETDEAQSPVLVPQSCFLTTAQMPSRAAHIGLAIWAIQVGGIFGRAEQYAECLLVVAHSGLYQFAVGGVELLCLVSEGADVFPQGFALGCMFVHPYFHGDIFHGVFIFCEQGFSAGVGDFYQLAGELGFDFAQGKQTFCIIAQ